MGDIVIMNPDRRWGPESKEYTWMTQEIIYVQDDKEKFGINLITLDKYHSSVVEDGLILLQRGNK